MKNKLTVIMMIMLMLISQISPAFAETDETVTSEYASLSVNSEKDFEVYPVLTGTLDDPDSFIGPEKDAEEFCSEYKKLSDSSIDDGEKEDILQSLTEQISGYIGKADKARDLDRLPLGLYYACGKGVLPVFIELFEEGEYEIDLESEPSASLTLKGDYTVYPVITGHDYGKDGFDSMEWADYISSKLSADEFYDKYLTSSDDAELTDFIEDQISNAKKSPKLKDLNELPLGIYYVKGDGFRSAFIELTEDSEVELEKVEKEPVEEVTEPQNTVTVKREKALKNGARSDEGTAYAVLTNASDSTGAGNLIFFRSYESYSNNTSGTFTDILGNTYSGNVFNDFETTITTDAGSVRWNNIRSNIKTVRIADGQLISPSSCNYWFEYCSKMTSCNLDGLNDQHLKGTQYMFSDCNVLTDVSFGDVDFDRVTNMQYMFNNCNVLTNLDVSDWNTQNVTNMRYMFSCCKAIDELDVSNFNTGRVADMSYMFNYCSSLAGLDVSNWNMNKVKKTTYMFYCCGSLTNLDVSNWNMGNVTDMSCMFSNCSSLTSLDVSDWDTGNVTNMTNIFNSCRALTGLDVSNWDVSNVISMSRMFYDCVALTNLDVSNWNTGNVTNMEYMFYNCISLTSFDISNWDVSSVTNMTYMFVNCTSLTTINASGLNASRVTDMANMFSGCTSLTSLNLSGLNAPCVTNMQRMFSGCSALINLNVSNWNVPRIKTTDYMFSNCASLINLDLSNWNTDNVTSMISMFAYCDALTSLDISNWNVSRVRRMKSMFYCCGSLTELDISNWDTGNVTDMASMFYNCGALTSLDLNSWDTSYVTYMHEMFYNCTALTSLDISDWDTNNVTNMTSMFEYCTSLTSLDLSSWDTSCVTSMKSMFKNCIALANLNMGDWDTGNVTSMEYMFSYCGALTEIDTSEWNTSRIEGMQCVFEHCTSLTSLDLSNWDTNNVTYMSSMFSYCTALTVIYASEKWNTAKVSDSTYMFHQCNRLPNFDSSYTNKTKAHYNDGGYLTYKASTSPAQITTGTAYAVLTDASDTSGEGNLILFRSENTYSNNTTGTFTDVSNNTYSGRVFAGIETTNTDHSGNCKWYNYRNSIKTVKVAEEQVIKPISCCYWFSCPNMTNCNLSGLDTSAVKYMSYMFLGCSSLTSLDVSGFNTNTVVSMTEMFKNCQNLTSLDLSSFDTKHVTSMHMMFYGCKALTSLDLSSFDTRCVTTMYQMFFDCESLTTLDIDNFNTKQVTIMTGTFSDCCNLRELDLSNFDTSNVTNCIQMFSNTYPEYIKIGPKAVFKDFNGIGDIQNVELTKIENLDGTTAIPVVTMLNKYNGSEPGKYKVGSFAYAVFDESDGSLTFFRDAPNQYQNGETDGTKTYYTDFEGDDIYSITSKWHSKNDLIKTIKFNDVIRPISCKDWFSSKNQLTNIINEDNLDVSRISDFENMFSGCIALTSLDISSWDVSKATSMKNMFSNCISLTSLDLNNWDVSNVSNIESILSGCRSLTDLNISNWNTSNITSMNGMFLGCKSLTNLDVRNLNTSHVTDMGYMFNHCESLTTLDLNNWDTSRVIYMQDMFDTCSALTTLDVSTWNTGHVQNMKRIFADCSSLNNLDLNDWDTGNVTNMSYMFSSCSSLTDLDINDWDTGNVADMSYMFSSCRSLTDLDINDWDTGNVADMSYIFKGCLLLNPNINNWDTSNVINMEGMFQECYALENFDLNCLDTDNVTNMAYMFFNCGSLTNLDIDEWDTSNVTNMSYMFSGCKSLTNLDIGNWDVSDVVNMSNMFSHCQTLINLDVSNWNVCRVRSMSGMFGYCYGLKSLDLNSWNTSNATNMSNMFTYCKALENIGISNFNTSHVTDMSGMFDGCNALKSLDLSSFDTNRASSFMSNMFRNCKALSVFTTGENFVFGSAQLPDDAQTLWKRQSTGETYTSQYLKTNHNASMADTYGKELKVSFNARGGKSEIASLSIFGSDIFESLPNATKTGYSFDGWYDADGNKLNIGDTPEVNIYYAHWIPNEYTLKLDPNGGDGNPVSVTLKYDQEYKLANPYTSDEDFSGWNTRMDGSGEFFVENESVSQLAEDGEITLYAQWSAELCNVRFDSNGGSAVPSRKVQKGAQLGRLYTPEKAGYTFDSWRDERNNSVSSSTRVNSDLVLSALWYKNPTITFDANDGEVNETEREVAYNKAIGELPIPYRNNYIFAGWFTEPNGGTKILPSQNLTQDTVCYAHWKIRPLFDPMGGVITQAPRPSDTGATIEVCKSSNVTDDGLSTTGGYGNNVSETKTVNIPGAEKLYITITYQTESADWVCIYGPDVTPTASNYDQSISGSLRGTAKTTQTFEIDGDTAQIYFYTNSSNCNYYGYYAEISDNAEAIGIFDPYTDDPEHYTVNAFAKAKKDGYVFDGWYTEPYGGTAIHKGDIIDLTQDCRIYAHWTPNEKITVTFDSNGAINISPLEFYKGQTFGVLPKPTHSNNSDLYIFEGWFDENDNEVTSADVADHDLHLTAKWSKAYYVDFNPQNGSYPYPTNSNNQRKYIKKDTEFGPLPISTRRGYIFDGWYTSYNGQGEKLTETTVISNNCTYYANWIANTPTPEIIDDNGLKYSYQVTWSDDSTDMVLGARSSSNFNASLRIRFEVNQATERTLPAGSVRIEIPKSVFKGWDGEFVGTNNIASNIPKYPNARAGLFFSYIENEDSYYLVNNTELSGGVGLDSTLNFTVSPFNVPGGWIDKDGNYGGDYYDENIPVIINFDKNMDGNFESSNNKSVHIECHTTALSDAKIAASTVYYKWNDSWGTKPDDAEDYFYIQWALNYNRIASSQPSYITYSMDTVHDGSVVDLKNSESPYVNHSNYSGSAGSVLMKYPKSLLDSAWPEGVTLTNQTVMTEYLKSGKEYSDIASASTTVYPRTSGYAFDKRYSGYSNTSDHYRTGAQETILDDKKEVDLPFTLKYSGNINSEEITWDEETKTYNAPKRTIMMRDGEPGDVMYAPGDFQKTAWEPFCGNRPLNDTDYCINSIDINLHEYDAEKHNGSWSEPLSHSDVSSYKPVEIWIRRRGEDTFEKYATQRFSGNNASALVYFPEDTVGFEIRHDTSFYSTSLEVISRLSLKPTLMMQNLIREDVDNGYSSIIKNKGICKVWNDDENDPFYEATNFRHGLESCFKDSYELTLSSTGFVVNKAAAPQSDTSYDVVNGTQDQYIAIAARNYNNSGRMKKMTSGTFYDLLPPGTSVDENTIYGVLSSSNSNSLGMSRSSYSPQSSSAINKNYYAVRFINNWQNSGRTMMIIDYGIPSSLKVNNKVPNGVFFYYKLHNTYENISDNGINFEGDVAFVNTSEEKTPYDRQKQSLIMTLADQGYYESLETVYGDDVAYSKAAIKFLPVNTFTWGYSQAVQSGNTIAADVAVIPNNEYTYRLTYAQSDITKADNLVIFDNLEAGNAEEDSEWQGEFQSINIDSLKNLTSTNGSKCAPVVWYTSDESVTGFDPENTAGWSTTRPSKVVAFAIDCRTCEDGTPFIMSGQTIANVYITMKSPTDETLYGKTAVNESICYNRAYTNGAPESAMSEQRSTGSVTLRGFDCDIHKSSDPQSGTQADPAGVAYGDVINYTLSITNNDTEFTYRDVNLQDTIPNDLRIEKNNVSVYIGDPATAVEIVNSARVNMTVTGQKLDFNVVEVLPGETLNIVIPCVIASRTGAFSNTASMDEINEVPYEKPSDTTYHDIKEIPVSFVKCIKGTSEKLPGATLQLLNSSNEVMQEWTSADEVKTVDLGPGKYRLRESAAPDGFLPAADIKFEVTRNGTVTCNTEGALSDNTITMYDKAIAVDVTVVNNTTGSGADKSKEFDYTVNVTGLVPNKTYSIKNSDETITADADGNASIDFSLKDGESLTIQKLPTDAVVTVTQEYDGYYISYQARSGDTVECSAANQESDVTTEEVTLDIEKGFTTFTFENSIDMITPTGVKKVEKGLLIIALLGAIVAVKRRKRLKNIPDKV